MPAHRLFDKGNNIYAILTSYNKPGIHLPIKGIIMDARWDPVNPKYLVKITKMYDKKSFIWKHFFDMTFCKSFDGRARPTWLKPENFDGIEELLKHMNGPNAARYYVTMDSIMCFSSLNELTDRFQKLQLYMISKSLKEVYECTSRRLYKGPMKTDGLSEYKAKMKVAWSDTFDDSEIDIDKYFDSLR